MALRWKKNPRPTGLAGVACGEKGSSLREGDEKYASTGTYSYRDKRKGWYWVARNDAAGVPLKNTCDEPVADEAAAKTAAMAYVRDCLKRQAEADNRTSSDEGAGNDSGVLGEGAEA